MVLPKSGKGIRIGQAFAHGKVVLLRTGQRSARRVGWASNYPLARIFAIAFNIDRAANPPKPRRSRHHYEVHTPRVDEPIGCTEAPSDVLREEPDATFKRVAKAKCSSCRGKE